MSKPKSQEGWGMFMATSGEDGASNTLKWRNADLRRRRATRVTDETVIWLVERLRRERQLNPDEVAAMERSARRLKPRNSIWRWSEKDDRILREFIQRRAYVGRPKPFQTDDEVRRLAQSINRTYEATHKRLQRLRKAMRRDDCPNAGKGRKG